MATMKPNIQKSAPLPGDPNQLEPRTMPNEPTETGKGSARPWRETHP
jgi:hypothetical protein